MRRAGKGAEPITPLAPNESGLSEVFSLVEHNAAGAIASIRALTQKLATASVGCRSQRG
jgi:hypothetical protein